MLEHLDDGDIRLINSGITRLDSWPKAFSDASNLRKADIRKRDIDERLTTKDFQSFINSQRAKEIKKMYEDVAGEERPTVGLINSFSAMRDYLLLRVMMASGQRCGAASNLTIYEFSNGVWTETGGGGQRVYIIRTLRHKTSSGGPAKLLWDEQLKSNSLPPQRFVRQREFSSTSNSLETNKTCSLQNHVKCLLSQLYFIESPVE
jgi:hypothetical protein